MPSNQHLIEITIPFGTSYEVVNVDLVDGWSAPNAKVARDFGRGWFQARRSAILVVPSVVARMERNIVFNTQHPDFRMVSTGL